MTLSAKGNGMYEEVMVAYKSQINDLPTIEERKKGEWNVIKNTGLAFCECGYFTDRYSIYNYCPNCGARMSE